MTMTHYNYDDPDEYNDNETYSLIESSTPVWLINNDFWIFDLDPCIFDLDHWIFDLYP